MPAELTSVINWRLKISRSTEQSKEPATLKKASTIYVVDGDKSALSMMRDVLTELGHSVETFSNAESFLASFTLSDNACLLVDVDLPGMSGLQLIQKLKRRGSKLLSIVISRNCSVPLAVQSMKAGAIDVLEKPISYSELLICVKRALELSIDQDKCAARHEEAVRRIDGITVRQREIMNMVLAGHPSKNIAADLGISRRTVENHRASIMNRTGTKSLPALARLAVSAEE